MGKREGKFIFKFNPMQSFFGPLSNLIQGDLLGNPKKSEPRQSLFGAFEVRQKRGQNEEKKDHKEGFEGAMPKEGAKHGAEGAPTQRGGSLATLLYTFDVTKFYVGFNLSNRPSCR